MKDERTEHPLALLVGGDRAWLAGCSVLCLENDVDVHTASRGRAAIDLLHKHAYDFIVIDDSLEDMSVLELSLYVPDLSSNNPLLLIACDEWARFQSAWRRCGASTSGDRPAVRDALRGHLTTTRARRGPGGL